MMSYLYNKKIKKCTIKITSKNIKRCRALWMADKDRYGRITLLFPLDDKKTYEKYGLIEQYYTDAKKYYEENIKELKELIENINKDLKLVKFSNSFLEEEKERLNYDLKTYEKLLKNLLTNLTIQCNI